MERFAHAFGIAASCAGPRLDEPRITRIRCVRKACERAAVVARFDLTPAAMPEQRFVSLENPILLGEPGFDVVAGRG